MKFPRVFWIAPLLFAVAALVGSCKEKTGVEPAESAPKYEAAWDSLTKHEVPVWLADAKFGIYAHWGVYSVPAFGNEWYARRMYDKKDKLGVFDFHRKTFGDQSEFGYKEFIPQFKAEKYNPSEWAELIAQSGAKYAGIAVVHHDGFGLWDSDVNRWNAGKMGPKRDLYGELVRALRDEQQLKTIATFHHIRTFDWFLPPTPEAIEEGQKAGWDLFDPEYADFYWNHYTGKFEDFIAQWQAKVREVIDKYEPDVLWFDGGKFQEDGAENIVLEVLSYYYNKSLEWGKPVDVLNKLPSSMVFNFPRDFGLLTFEEGRDRPAEVDRPWIDDMKISTESWGYIEGQTYKSANEIIDGLIDRTSRGGGLLLSLCPKADGTISDEQKEVLLSMGSWLKVNGEAIYGTRPWKIHSEGPVEKLIQQGTHSKWVFENCSSEDVRFTTRGNTLYAIALGWPENGELTIQTLGSETEVSRDGEIQNIQLLGSSDEISWSRTEQGLVLSLPENKPNDLAYAFKIELAGELSR